MPRIVSKEPKIKSLDTEVTGLDVRHGAQPYFVSMATNEDDVLTWEWDVDPLSRKVEPPTEDLEEIQQEIDDADLLILQNAKFDCAALDNVMPNLRWDWSKVHDTLLAGHLLASNQPHTLSAMCLIYLGVNIQHLDDDITEAANKARRSARSQCPDWRIAHKDLPEMPSAKAKISKFDAWLPRAMCKQALKLLDVSLLPDHPRLPTVGRVENCEIRIDRGTKWGNPFTIPRDGNREQVVRRYVDYILQSRLLADLPELYGKLLGCYCNPKLCHGDILRLLCHPWWTTLSDYGASDAEATLHLYFKQKELLKERNLWRIYLERLKLLPIVYGMESRGVTLSKRRLDQLTVEYTKESRNAEKICVNIAAKYDYDLKLPKNGRNQSLTDFVFGRGDICSECNGSGFKTGRGVKATCSKCKGVGNDAANYLNLEPLTRSDKTGKPSMNKTTLEHWESALPEGTHGHNFIKALRAKRKRDTALTYMRGYRRFWLPIATSGVVPGRRDWYVLHPSLNSTGTDTLRWSSQNPNEQNISKQQGFNLRYCFGPAPGREWWALDAKNIELRIPAYESGEESLIELFERPDDPPFYGSQHLLNFSVVYPDIWRKELKSVGEEKVGPHCKKKYESTWYQWCKNGDFAVQYGAVDRDDGEGTADRAFYRPGSHAKLKSRFAKQEKLNQKWIDFANKHGYVETLPDKTVDPKRGYPLYCSRTQWGGIKPTIPLNYHVQGSAMWVMCRMMTICADYLRELGEDYFLIIQVHDEIVLDFPLVKDYGNLPKVRELKRRLDLMGEDLVPRVPLSMGIEYHAKSWAESKTFA